MAEEGCERVVVYLGEVDAGHAAPFGWYVSLQWLDAKALPLGEALRSRRRRRSSAALKTAVAMPREAGARFLQLRVMKRHLLRRDEAVAEHVVPLAEDLCRLQAGAALHEARSLAHYCARWRLAGGLLHLPRMGTGKREAAQARECGVRKAHSAALLASAAQLPAHTRPTASGSEGALAQASQAQALALSSCASSAESGGEGGGEGDSDAFEEDEDGEWCVVEAPLAAEEEEGVTAEPRPVLLQFGMRLQELLHAPPEPVFRWLAVNEKPGWLLRRGTLYVDVCVKDLVPKTISRFSARASISSQRLPFQNLLPQEACEKASLAEYRLRLAFAILQGELPETVLLEFKGEGAKGGHSFAQTRELQLDWKMTEAVGSRGLLRCVGRMEDERLSAATVSCFALAEVSCEEEWDMLTISRDLDMTERFEEEVKAVRELSAREVLEQAPAIAERTFVLVGGLFTEFYPGYFAPNRAALAQLKAKCIVAPIRTECGCEFNAPIIAETAEKAAAEGRRVILISHSKGGTDIHAAVALFPHLREVVEGIIMFQPVFGGTIGVEEGVSKVFSKANERLLKGERQALDDLSYDSRFEFIRKHGFPAADIPTLCLSSYVSTGEEASSVFGQLVDKAMQLTSSMTMSRTHFRSDGLVVRADARVPGAYEVILSNMAHGAPAFEVPGAHYQASTIMVACIRLLLAIIEQRARG